MTSTSTRPISDRASALGDRNAAGVTPPACAAVTPLDEFWIEELAAMLPEELARALRATTNVERLTDWLAAGALYGLIANDTYATRRFVEEVTGDPKRANEKLLKLLVERMHPPERDARWHQLDRVGLLLQLATCLALLVGRSVVLLLLSRFAFQSVNLPWLVKMLFSPLGVDLLFGSPLLVFGSPVLLIVASMLLAAEARLGPIGCELVRQIPAAQRGLPPPLSWRADALHVVWYGQCVLLAFLLCLRGWWLSLVALISGSWNLWQSGVGVLMTVVFGIVFVHVLSSARQAIAVGTRDLMED